VIVSADKITSIPDGLLDALECRVAHEELERDHHRARGHALGALREPRVNDHHLGVGRDRVDGQMVDGDVVLLEPVSPSGWPP